MEFSSRMQSPDLIPVLVGLKRGPDMLASGAHEENGLQDVSQRLDQPDFPASLPFPSRQSAVATGRRRRLSRYSALSDTLLRRAGAVQVDLSANAAEQMSQCLYDHVMYPPLASLKTRRWTRPSPSARL